ncbi:hypothetical protein SEVIR_3G171600v4 [Setaria viridis]|uniref:NB-ARC domain-containing protein n=1 Tax=Setaria viridis TaxID=4556 RepID=A0A4U6VNZ5_SETVI|nr:disease resistance protein RGA2-like [Setaria viridis]TKW26207.1 hypothetical protein SEVIR_3G171600v2 [Setaria viridis]
MEMFYSSVITELVNSSISFLFAKFKKETTATVQEDLQLLRRLLMRSDTIVEEADRRRVSNPDMLQQLKALRDKAYRGYYVLDTVRCRALLEGGSRGGEDKEEPAKRLTFALSRFNPAKRVRFPSGGDSEPTTVALNDASPRELHQMVCSLQAMIDGMDEFVVLLMSCPPLYRQPYSVHLSLDRCMFGRHMEKETVMEFLLNNTEPPPSDAVNLGVLPIIGPTHIGKSTLVEHVCHDEKVRNHFSLISIYSGDDLKDETKATFREKCVIKHQNNQAIEKRLLVVIELIADVDEEAWERLYSCERSMPQGSKMIITSRSEKIARFGTTEPLRLKPLPVEAYWYLFKTVAFGSDDPGHHPKLASIALEMVDAMQGSFIFASMGGDLLRANFDTRTWSRVLTRLRQYLQKNASLIGEYPDDVNVKDYPRVTWSVIKEKPDKYFMLHDIYQRGSAHGEVPQISLLDLLAGRAQPSGKYEILFLKSRIPPYFNYICTCEIRDM